MRLNGRTCELREAKDGRHFQRDSGTAHLGANVPGEGWDVRRRAQGQHGEHGRRRHYEALVRPGTRATQPVSLPPSFLGLIAEPMLSLRFSSVASDRCSRVSLLGRHVVAYDSDGVPSAYGSRGDGEIWLEVPDVATFHLPPGSASLTAIPEESVDSGAVLDAYYGTALPLVVQATRGLEVLHGSGVLVQSRGFVVAFCGTSESGKSTVAYGLAARGYRHWADDAVAFQVDGPHSVTTIGLPFTVKLRETSSEYFRGYSDALEVVEEFEWKPSRLGAIFLLEPLDEGASEESVVLEQLAPGEAVRRLLPNAFRFHPQPRERRRGTMRSYLDLVASVPIVSVRFPHDLHHFPNLLDQLERWMNEIA